VPFEQTEPAGQTLLQLPQCSKLFVRLAQKLPQFVNGAAQAVTQVPPLQSGAVPGQMTPQLPQFDGSSARMVHTWFPVPPQSVKLPWQAHEPPEQTWYCEVPQEVPQAPQFAGSVCRSVQAVPHGSGVDPPQLTAHAPAEHTCEAEHFVPHAPQFWGSVWRLVQKLTEPLVQVSGVLPRQPVAQTPPVHTWPAEQVLPQLPQFFPSLRRSTHSPEQLVFG